MNNVCSICDQVPTFPMKLTCGDTFCFLCIKTHIIISSITCPKCGQFVSDDLNNVLLNEVDDEGVFASTVYWMYSSNVGNFWWCYDKMTSRAIENMYQHYNNLKNQDNNVEDGSHIDIDFKNIKTRRSRKKKVGISENFQAVDSVAFDPVNFDEISESSSSEDGEEESVTGNYDGVMYSVQIGKMKYRIDFDAMKQINLLDTYKKRTIRRVEVPDSVNVPAYLKNTHRVLGIAGIKF